jgi:hypothetical protein
MLSFWLPGLALKRGLVPTIFKESFKDSWGSAACRLSISHIAESGGGDEINQIRSRTNGRENHPKMEQNPTLGWFLPVRVDTGVGHLKMVLHGWV